MLVAVQNEANSIPREMGEKLKNKIGAKLFLECNLNEIEDINNVIVSAIKLVIMPETKEKSKGGLFSRFTAKQPSSKVTMPNKARVLYTDDGKNSVFLHKC